MGVSRSRGSAGGVSNGVFRNVPAHVLIGNEVKLPEAAAALTILMKTTSAKKVRRLDITYIYQGMHVMI